MSSVRVYRCEAEHPETVLDRELKQFTAASPPELLVLVDFCFEEYWQQPSNRYALVALYHLVRRSDGVRVKMSVCAPENIGAELQSPIIDSEQLQKLELPWFELGQPLRLRPLFIPKPWGREIWYTGIEQRGVAAVSDGERETLLPWLLAIAPARFCHSLQRQLILLKILDPLPDAVFGDLYFELHREKREVYVSPMLIGARGLTVSVPFVSDLMRCCVRVTATIINFATIIAMQCWLISACGAISMRC